MALGGRGSRRASWGKDLLGRWLARSSVSQFFHSTSPREGNNCIVVGDHFRAPWWHLAAGRLPCFLG